MGAIPRRFHARGNDNFIDDSIHNFAHDVLTVYDVYNSRVDVDYSSSNGRVNQGGL